MNKLTPPISRMGGKSKLRNKIIQKIPQHVGYIELFFGAGWVFFGKKESKLEIINDVDDRLINLFRIIKRHPRELERLLELEPIACRQRFNESLKGLSQEFCTDIEKAVNFMYAIRYSFGAKGEHFGYSKRSAPRNLSADIASLSTRLQNTYIENLDYKTVIDKYDAKENFFFIDPPYINTAQYRHPFSIEEHSILRDKIENLKGKFMLTINDSQESRDLYSSFNIEEVSVMYSIASKENKKANELIVTNY